MVEPVRKSRRRWFQFSLRSLMGLVTLTVALLVAFRVWVAPYREQRAAIAAFEEMGARYSTKEAPKWIARLLQDPKLSVVVWVDLRTIQDPQKYMRHVMCCTELNGLTVAGPRVEDSHVRQFSQLTALRALELDSTAVSPGCVAQSQSARPDLRVFCSEGSAINALQARGCHVKTIAANDPELTRRVRLRTLLPRRNEQLVVDLFTVPQRMDAASMEVFRGVSAARLIWLDDNPIPDSCLQHLSHLETLEWLSLTKTDITDAGLEYLRPLTNLKVLWLNETQISDAGLRRLTSLRELEELDLRSTQVSDDGLMHLATLPRLRTVYLSRSRVSAAGVARLRQMLPDTFVLHYLQ
jgi:hypothetical protein